MLSIGVYLFQGEEGGELQELQAGSETEEEHAHEHSHVRNPAVLANHSLRRPDQGCRRNVHESNSTLWTYQSRKAHHFEHGTLCHYAVLNSSLR